MAVAFNKWVMELDIRWLAFSMCTVPDIKHCLFFSLRNFPASKPLEPPVTLLCNKTEEFENQKSELLVSYHKLESMLINRKSETKSNSGLSVNNHI